MSVELNLEIIIPKYPKHKVCFAVLVNVKHIAFGRIMCDENYWHGWEPQTRHVYTVWHVHIWVDCTTQPG